MARLADIREKRGWSQHDLAERAGLSIGTIGQIEAGRGHPVAGTIRRICEALGVAPEEIDEFR